MRPEFEQRLRVYSKISKDRLREKELKKDVEDLDSATRWFTQKAAEERESPVETQQEILGIQEKKQELMKKLKENLANLDNPEHREERKPGQRFIEFKDGEYFWSRRTDRDGNEEPPLKISLGEIMTDFTWDVDQYLDPNSVPRIIRKEYLICRARHELMKLLDRQIMLDEIASPRTDVGRRGAYERSLADIEAGEQVAGWMTEQMVQNFFTKLIYDFDMDFRVEQADVYQDVNQKVDFIIHRKKRYRGVGVEETERKNIGIQFTTVNRGYGLSMKRHQVARAKERLDEEDIVEDIVLVSIPLPNARKVHKKWIRALRAPGGPDKMWGIRIKEHVFRAVMEGFLEDEEIEKAWKKISEGK